MLHVSINKYKYIHIYTEKREGNGNPLQSSCLEISMERILVSYSPWGHKESDMTEPLSTHTEKELRDMHHILILIIPRV